MEKETTCKECGVVFTKTGSRDQWCLTCRAERQKAQQAAYRERVRLQKPNRDEAKMQNISKAEIEFCLQCSSTRCNGRCEDLIKFKKQQRRLAKA